MDCLFVCMMWCDWCIKFKMLGEKGGNGREVEGRTRQDDCCIVNEEERRVKRARAWN